MSELHLRQFDILRATPDLPIHVVGAGGIGSPTVLTLAKMGYENITVYDFDEVEEHNVNSQFYRLDDLGKPKLEALKENVKAFTGVDIKTVEGEVEELNGADIIIMAVDNMTARKTIYDNSKGYRLYIDGRMGGEIFNIYSFTPYDSTQYEATLYSDEDAEETPCTAKAIAYNTFGIASQIANLVKKFDKNQSFPFEINGDYVNIKLYKSK